MNCVYIFAMTKFVPVLYIRMGLLKGVASDEKAHYSHSFFLAAAKDACKHKGK